MRLRKLLAGWLLGARIEEERVVVATGPEGQEWVFAYDSDAKGPRDAESRVLRGRSVRHVKAMRTFYTARKFIR